MGPGVAPECVETQDGLTLWEDHFYPEIIDPASGEVLPDGEKGELVLTSLTKEALPVIRYRTRDLTRLLPGTARTMRRMEKITGRSDDMLIIRGVNVFPSQIEELLLKQPGLSPHYVLEAHQGRPARSLTVIVEGDAAAMPRPAARHQVLHRHQRRREDRRGRALHRQSEARDRQAPQVKTVLVTGGGGAIGSAICRRFSKDAKVLVADKNREAAERVASEVGGDGAGLRHLEIRRTRRGVAGRSPSTSWSTTPAGTASRTSPTPSPKSGRR